MYGAFRVAAGAYTGGTVLNVLMSVLLGGFAIMQGAPTIQYLIKVRERAICHVSVSAPPPLYYPSPPSTRPPTLALPQGKLAGARIFHIINRCPAIGPPAPATNAAATPEGPSKVQQGFFAAAAPAAVIGGGGGGKLSAAPAGGCGGGGGKPSSNDIAAAEEGGGGAVPLVGCEKLEGLKGELELQGVSFAYPARMDVQIFTDFSLKIPAGDGGEVMVAAITEMTFGGWPAAAPVVLLNSPLPHCRQDDGPSGQQRQRQVDGGVPPGALLRPAGGMCTAGQGRYTATGSDLAP